MRSPEEQQLACNLRSVAGQAASKCGGPQSFVEILPAPFSAYLPFFLFPPCLEVMQTKFDTSVSMCPLQFDVNNTGQLCESELKAAFRSKVIFILPGPLFLDCFFANPLDSDVNSTAGCQHDRIRVHELH